MAFEGIKYEVGQALRKLRYRIPSLRFIMRLSFRVIVIGVYAGAVFVGRDYVWNQFDPEKLGRKSFLERELEPKLPFIPSLPPNVPQKKKDRPAFPFDRS